MAKYTENKVANLLLIEDDKVDQMAVAKSLENSTFKHKLEIMDEIETKLTEDTIRKISQFDLVILDYSLPSGVASNILHLIKKHWNLNTIIVVFTGVESNTLKENLEAYNNVYYLLKSKESFANLPKILKNYLIQNFDDGSGQI